MPKWTWKRGSGYGMPYQASDGNDLDAVIAAVREAADRPAPAKARAIWWPIRTVFAGIRCRIR